MKKNKLREILKEGKPTLGTRLLNVWPGMVELVGNTGLFDYVEYLGEYSPWDLHDLGNFGRAVELFEWMGYSHIGQEYAQRINGFYFSCFHEYLNFQRPCAFPMEIMDKKGKIKKKYRYQDYRTPYEKLRSIPEAQTYLKEGITLEMLDKISQRYTDNEMAEKVQLERDRLFDKILAA